MKKIIIIVSAITVIVLSIIALTGTVIGNKNREVTIKLFGETHKAVYTMSLADRHTAERKYSCMDVYQDVDNERIVYFFLRDTDIFSGMRNLDGGSLSVTDNSVDPERAQMLKEKADKLLPEVYGKAFDGFIFKEVTHSTSDDCYVAHYAKCFDGIFYANEMTVTMNPQDEIVAISAGYIGRMDDLRFDSQNVAEAKAKAIAEADKELGEGCYEILEEQIGYCDINDPDRLVYSVFVLHELPNSNGAKEGLSFEADLIA